MNKKIISLSFAIVLLFGAYERARASSTSTSLGTFSSSATLGAFSINYQKISQIKGDEVGVSVYGTDGSKFVVCNVEDLVCGETTESAPNLYSEFASKNYQLSSGRDYAVVDESADGKTVYGFYKVSGSGAIKEKTLNFSKSASKIKISGDGTKILFATRDGYLTLFDVSQNREIDKFPYVGGLSFLTFSHKGNYVAYYKPSTLSSNIKTFTLLDLKNKGMYSWDENNAYWDLLTEEDKLFDFSPDESEFVYLSDFGGYQSLYSVQLKKLSGMEIGRIGKPILKKKAVVSSFVFSDSDNLYFVANRDNPLIWNLYKYVFSTGTVYRVADKVAYWPGIAKTGNNILFYKIGERPSEVYVFDTKKGGGKRLVNDPASGKDMAGIGSTQVAYGKLKQYGNVSAGLLKPDNFSLNKKYDVVLWLHGGPYRQTSLGYHPYLSYGVYDVALEELRRAGFVVLKIDYRGSYGYSTKFAKDLTGNVGKKDVEDVMTVLTGIGKEIKMGKVYLMGNSYGGYLALKTLAEKPKSFAGAVSINGVTDWRVLLENIPSSIFKVQFNGIPNGTNNRLYTQASIVSRLDNFSNEKVLLVYGENDGTVPVAQTQDFYEKLWEKIGDGVEIFQLPEEEHVIKGKANLEDFYREVKRFLGVKV